MARSSRAFRRYFYGQALEPFLKRRGAGQQVPFDSPPQLERFNQGNMECQCGCQAKAIPRNAILIRLEDPALARNVYNMMVAKWRKHEFARMGLGSCQTFLRTREVEKDIDIYASPNTKIQCIDNIDNSQLRSGDILLTRIGTRRSIGKPFLIR